LKDTDKEVLKKGIIYVLSSLLAIAAIVYIVYHIVSYFKEDMRVEPVQYAEQSENLTLTAVIFRDEQVIYGDRSGGVVRLYSNGERVGKNAVVARVYETLRTEDYTLSRIEKRLGILTESNKISDNTTKNTDAKINKLYYTVRLKSEEGDFSTLSEKTDELLILLNRREIIVNARLNFNTEIADLKAMRDRMLASGSSVGYDVTTDVSGYFSGFVDGYENIFTSDKALKYGYKELSGLLRSEADELSVTDKGYAVGKVAHLPTWYICAETDRDTAYKLSEGESYTIGFPMASGSETEFRLERIVAENGGEGAMLVFSTDIQSAEIGSARKQTVSVTMEKTTGLRVPISAVRTDDDNNTGVYILKNNKVTFRKIDILTEGDGYCIVREYAPDEEGYAEMLHQYDNLIISGKGLKEQANTDDGETTEYEIRIFG
jgi:hypothetical protein